MDPSYRRPRAFLLGTIVVGILMVVVAAMLLRKPVATNPFDEPASTEQPAAGGRQ